MSKVLLVFGEKNFKITIPDKATITFGPWSPPGKSAVERNYGGSNDMNRSGTLRVYAGAKTTSNIIAVFSGVRSFRSMEMEYAEEVAREEGAIIWNSDSEGYQRQEKVSKSSDWIDPSHQIGTSQKTKKNLKEAKIDDISF